MLWFFIFLFFFFSSRRRHTRSLCDWSSDVCSSDLRTAALPTSRSEPYGLRCRDRRVPLRGWRSIAATGVRCACSPPTARYSCSARRSVQGGFPEHGLARGGAALPRRPGPVLRRARALCALQRRPARAPVARAALRLPGGCVPPRTAVPDGGATAEP